METAMVSDAQRHREAIFGMERRVERDERNGNDTTVPRILLMQHYAAYAMVKVEQAGGNLTELHTLTDRNNCVPLAWARDCVPVD